jgi:hypothetical protein
MNKHNLETEMFDLVEIESIELIGDTNTIDITVEDTHMFFANDIYSHNSGAHSDIIEADKIAGSYDKIMIADFAMSLSRKRSDKLNGTGRIHVIKNRFGSDGMTFSAKINTANGHIDIDASEMDDSELKVDTGSAPSGFSRIDNDEKKYLSSKFFELGL